MDLEKLDQYDKRLDGAPDKSQNVKDYIGIMDASRGSVKAKQVAVRLIPKYFKHFPILSLPAIDRYVNLCKDKELEVRVQAILGLPQFCQDTPKYIPKLVDVLGQLPPAGEYVERDAVQISLYTILCLAVKNYKMHQEEEDLFDVPPSIGNPADFGKNVDISRTSQYKIGVIDSGFSGTHTSRDLQCFVRPPISKSYHSCEAPAMLSPHGFACASVISGRRRNVKFFGVCDKEIHGVIPDAQLYTYALGCKNCTPQLKFAWDAIDDAVQDGVKVISMSQGLKDFSLIRSPKDDRLGKKLLDASDKVLACLAVGNDGPREGTAFYGMPWVFSVGGCTSGEILVTDVEIAVATIPSGVHILDRQEDRGIDFYIIDRIQGVSLNVNRSHFCKLSIMDGSEGEESVLYDDDEAGIFKLSAARPWTYCKSIIVAPPVTANSWATIYKEDTHKLVSWHEKFRGQLFVRILQSKYQKDGRGVFVADFSSRGPSRIYQNNIIPDIVAPGYAVLTSHPSTVELNYKERIENPSLKKILNDHTIVTGTSLACPLVAAYALIVCSYYPDLKPSAIKSALITTASSFASRGIPGNEFVFGAGAVDLERALNPGLVYEESEFNFRRYVDGDIKIFDLNLPTFAAAFPHSHLFCEKMFARELKNVGKDDGAYKFEVQFFNKSPSDKVEITAEPDYLEFKHGEKQKFVLKVKICPRPYASVSALVKWVPTSGDRCCVSSPLILYHHTEYDQEVEYKVYK